MSEIKYSIHTIMIYADDDGRSVIEHQHFEPRKGETVEQLIERVFAYNIKNDTGYSDVIEIQRLRSK